MNEQTSREHLQPALLDRLTDEAPAKKTETRNEKVISMRRLKQAILRDLAWLFNTTHLAAVRDLSEFPNVSHSTLNYGVPDFSGQTASGADIDRLEQALKQAICDFEPRILRKTLVVRAVVAKDEMSYNAVCFEIEGELWAQPAPEHLVLRTELDLENGDVKVEEAF